MQVFHPSSNTIAKATIIGGLLGIVTLIYAGVLIDRSPYVTRVSVPIEQPIQFSHEHHVRGLGIDCRYCHTTVEKSAFAGIPPTETCMTCHSQIWSNSHMLARVRESWQTQTPIRWNRVHDLPDFAYFNHAIHVNKGVGCSTCHGRVDTMPLTWKTQTLRMEWCLDCHRQPQMHLRPKEEIYSMTWEPPADQFTAGEHLKKLHNVNETGLTNCSTCHR